MRFESKIFRSLKLPWQFSLKLGTVRMEKLVMPRVHWGNKPETTWFEFVCTRNGAIHVNVKATHLFRK